MNITETISELDGIYAKPYWTAQERSIFVDNFPALRRAVMAGAKLAKAVEEYVISHTADHDCAYAGDIDHFIAEQVHAYRSAIEEKNV